MELGVILLLITVWLAAAATVHHLVRKEWQATWQGHRIAVRNYMLTEQLLIDGQLVASTTAGPRGGSTLTGAIEHEGESIPVMASINVGLGRLDLQLFVDGRAIPTTSGRIGALEVTAAPPSIEAAPDPRDARWAAVRELLATIRAHRPPEEVAALCEQAEAELRQLLLDIETLEHDAEAHRLLGEPEQPPDETLAALCAAKEAEARALFAAVQKLHRSVLAGDSDTQAATLAARLTARAEVEAAASPVSDKAARTRAARAARKTKA